MPDFFGDRGGFLVNVGAFGGGYGSAGRYDAGAYGTYVFGRTHASGETISAFYDITDEITLQAEHGIGARLDVTPLDPARPVGPLAALPRPGPAVPDHASPRPHRRDLPRPLPGGPALPDRLDPGRHARPASADGRITSFGGRVQDDRHPVRSRLPGHRPYQGQGGAAGVRRARGHPLVGGLEPDRELLRPELRWATATSPPWPGSGPSAWPPSCATPRRSGARDRTWSPAPSACTTRVDGDGDPTFTGATAQAEARRLVDLHAAVLAGRVRSGSTWSSPT